MVESLFEEFEFSAHSLDDGDRCQPQRILVVDESDVRRAAFRSVLLNEDWVAACFGVGSFTSGLMVARRRQPQIVLVSTSVRGESGLEFCTVIRERVPLARTVLMSSDDNVSATRARAHGAVGFLSLRTSAASITGALHRVAEGAKVFPRAPVRGDGNTSSVA